MPSVKRFDPAPSRLKYRLERLFLTPAFRFTMRVLLPFGLAFGGASYWLAQPANQDKVLTLVSDIRAEIEQRPEFMVKLMAIDGASEGVSRDIREIVPVDFPISSFDLDLDAMKEIIMGLDAVRMASVRVKSGGVLQIDVQERIPVLVWRHRYGLELLDSEGVMTGPAVRRSDHPDLPVVAGEGANTAVREALRLFAVAGPLAPRLRGLVRVGERRWDVVLDRDQRILLPEQHPVRAFERAIAMHQVMDMLERDVARVDLRLPHRPTIQISENAVRELVRIRAIERGDDSQ